MSKNLAVSIALEALKADEGYRPHPYRCTAGKVTIGYGRNLDDKGITKDEAVYLLTKDIVDADKELYKAFPFIVELSYARQAVLINMCVNMGITRLKKFKRMWVEIEGKMFSRAALEMLDSRWSQQVGDRAKRLAAIMGEE